MKRIIFIGTLSALLAACASAPQRSDQLELARTQIQTLSQEPLAQQVAASDLEAARGQLQAGDMALAQHKPLVEVDHLAYLAQHHAQTGEARVAEANSRQEIARAEQGRNEVLLAARSHEADTAKVQLAESQRQLAELQARPTDRGMVVTLGDVLFDTGRATLKPGAGLVLDRLASFMSANPQTKVVVEGHTDSTGSVDSNELLSQRRADAVASALLLRRVPADNVRALGRGQEYPVASNATAEGRQQNRRVEIVFSDASGRFAQTDIGAVRR